MTTETIITEAMLTEGKAIAKIVTDRKKTFKGDIATDGYVMRLGNLMLQLEEIAKQAGKKRVSSKMIKDAGLNSVSSAIRCEAKWFVQNETEAREFIKASKKGFTNVSWLKSEMATAAKELANAAKAAEKAEASTESESENATTEGEGAALKESSEADTLDVPTIAIAIHALASRDGKSVYGVIDEIIDLFEETNPLTSEIAA